MNAFNSSLAVPAPSQAGASPPTCTGGRSSTLTSPVSGPLPPERLPTASSRPCACAGAWLRSFRGEVLRGTAAAAAAAGASGGSVYFGGRGGGAYAPSGCACVWGCACGGGGGYSGSERRYESSDRSGGSRRSTGGVPYPFWGAPGGGGYGFCCGGNGCGELVLNECGDPGMGEAVPVPVWNGLCGARVYDCCWG